MFTIARPMKKIMSRPLRRKISKNEKAVSLGRL